MTVETDDLGSGIFNKQNCTHTLLEIVHFSPICEKISANSP